MNIKTILLNEIIGRLCTFSYKLVFLYFIFTQSHFYGTLITGLVIMSTLAYMLSDREIKKIKSKELDEMLVSLEKKLTKEEAKYKQNNE